MFLAALLKPFFAAGCLLIGYPITWWVKNRMKDGKLKRFLLIRW